MRQPILIYASKTKLMTLLVLGIIMTVGSYFALISGDPRGFFVGILGFPLFGTALIFTTYKTFSRRPVLKFEEAGLTTNTGWGHQEFLPWGEIEKVFLLNFGTGSTTICIVPKDVPAYMAKLGPIKRKLCAISMRFGGAPIGIPASSLPMEAQAVIRKIRSHISTANQSQIAESTTIGPSAIAKG